MYGNLDTILLPINHEMLNFKGMQVLPPYTPYSTDRLAEEERLHEI